MSFHFICQVNVILSFHETTGGSHGLTKEYIYRHWTKSEMSFLGGEQALSGTISEALWVTGCEKTGCVKTRRCEVRWVGGRGGCWGLSPKQVQDLLQVPADGRRLLCYSDTLSVTSGCSRWSSSVFTGKSNPQTLKAPPPPGPPSAAAGAAFAFVCLLFSWKKNGLAARPLIVIHPSRAPVYKREIRISITRARRQRDWCVSHRIPSVSPPKSAFRECEVNIIQRRDQI